MMRGKGGRFLLLNLLELRTKLRIMGTIIHREIRRILLDPTKDYEASYEAYGASYEAS